MTLCLESPPWLRTEGTFFFFLVSGFGIRIFEIFLSVSDCKLQLERECTVYVWMQKMRILNVD